jgi:integrase
VTLRKRSWKRDKQHYELRIKPAIGNLKLDQITRQRIQTLHSAALEEGLAASSANGIVRIIRYSMNLALLWQLYPGPNPAARIPMFHEDNQVNNLLSDEQLDGLLNVLRTDKNRMVCGIVLFLMATGTRLSEALSATWSDIDLEKRSFVIRATNSKSKRLRAVPLNDTAMEVLLSLPTRDNHEYVFVNKQTDRPYTTIAKQWDRIRKQANVPFFRIHDARHTYAALLASSGVSLWTISTLLGHSDPKISTRYAHLTTKALESASNVAALKLSGQRLYGGEGKAVAP